MHLAAMELRFAFFVAFGPALTSCLDCSHSPPMPPTFFAKRRFGSLLNTIDFSDQFGREFGYVESWFIDWKNPFGYPGASFYLKTITTTGDRVGSWKLNPGQKESVPNPSANAAGVQGTSEKKHQLLASMNGKHAPPVGSPTSDEMYVKDCNGVQKFEAGKKNIHVHKAGKDAQFFTKQVDAENSLVITDFNVPTIELMRAFMSSSCVPFPPFCAQMGKFNWLIYGSEWEGQIVKPGYNVTAANATLGVAMTDGAATDMRFLALYTSYQFSNTRFSPLMFIVVNLVLCVCCVCFIRCCFCEYRYRSNSNAASSTAQEKERLMSTIESPKEHNAHEAPKEKPPSSGLWNCCSRKGGGGGRTVSAAPTHH